MSSSSSLPRWRGIFPAVTTKFHADESLDVAAMEKHFEFLIAHGVDGLVTGGSAASAGGLASPAGFAV